MPKYKIGMDVEIIDIDEHGLPHHREWIGRKARIVDVITDPQYAIEREYPYRLANYTEVFFSEQEIKRYHPRKDLPKCECGAIAIESFQGNDYCEQCIADVYALG